MLAKPFPQFAVPRIAPDQVLWIGLKQILQGKAPLLLRQILCRLGRDAEKRILRRARRVILDLHHERGHEIEVLVDVGELVQQLHHAVIIFECVQADPREAILARNQVLVVRLMLVPENDDAQCRH